MFYSKIDRIESIKKDKVSRVNVLSGIREVQENRIDSLYKKNYLNGVKKTETIIKESSLEISKLNKQIDSLEVINNSLSDSISVLDQSISSNKSNDLSSEVGPIKYVAILTGQKIETIVNFLIFLLIFVFDPLAICLVVATNKVALSEKNITVMKIPEVGKELDPVDVILNKYLEVCKKACEDDEMFRKFKSQEDYKQVLEHLTKGIGENHLRLIEKNNPDLLYIHDFFKNDLIGTPTLEELVTREGEVIKCSPTTLQYISVLCNLIDLYGGLSSFNIVEVGGGYGGQCKIINDFNRVESYTIVDLEEAGALQEKYLTYFNINDNLIILNDLEYKSFLKNEYDLFISNYAITELKDSEQLEYVKNICLKSKRGYITCNSELVGMNLIKNKFANTFRISKDIDGERATNFVITW